MSKDERYPRGTGPVDWEADARVRSTPRLGEAVAEEYLQHPVIEPVVDFRDVRVSQAVSDAEIEYAAQRLWEYRYPTKPWREVSYVTHGRFCDEAAVALKAAAFVRLNRDSGFLPEERESHGGDK